MVTAHFTLDYLATNRLIEGTIPKSKVICIVYDGELPRDRPAGAVVPPVQGFSPEAAMLKVNK